LVQNVNLRSHLISEILNPHSKSLCFLVIGFLNCHDKKINPSPFDRDVIYGLFLTYKSSKVAQISSQFHQHFARAFLPIFWHQKISNPKHSFVIFGAKILYKKHEHKMLMKSTPGCVKTFGHWNTYLRPFAQNLRNSWPKYLLLTDNTVYLLLLFVILTILILVRPLMLVILVSISSTFYAHNFGTKVFF